MFNRETWQINRERHRQLIEVAQAHRLTQLGIHRSNRRERLMVGLGDLLVTWGLRLKARYQQVPCDAQARAQKEVGLLF